MKAHLLEILKLNKTFFDFLNMNKLYYFTVKDINIPFSSLKSCVQYQTRINSFYSNFHRN